jgi:hypothetical protein
MRGARFLIEPCTGSAMPFFGTIVISLCVFHSFAFEQRDGQIT